MQIYEENKFIKDCMSLTDWPTEIPTYRTSLSGLENNYNIWLSGKKVIEISKKFVFYINPILYLWYCKCLLANPIYAIFDSLICWIESASPLWELPGLNSYSWLDKRGSIHPFQTITKWANRTVLLRTDRFWITISLWLKMLLKMVIRTYSIQDEKLQNWGQTYRPTKHRNDRQKQGSRFDQRASTNRFITQRIYRL